MRHCDVLIVGAGHAGAQAAISLRQRSFAGSILLLGDETVPPYERPPLSKEYLAGKKPFDRIMLRPAEFWAERAIDLQLGARVVSVDPSNHLATTQDGQGISYGVLIWAAGGEPRRLPCEGAGLGGIHHIRRKDDADRLARQLRAGARRAVIVGGGYIGLEAAAVLRGFGLEVALVEAQSRLLARVAGAELSDFYAAEHRRQGVDIRLGAGVARFEGAAGSVSATVLAGGERLPCDLVVTGIGVEPCVAPLIAAGAAGANGVDVDPFCRTSLPDIYAIGDCAAHANRHAGDAQIRLESVQNASDMADTAAASICGTPQPYDALPWFWSNQYDLKLQTLGLCGGHDATILRGDPGDRAFSVLYLKQGRIAALDCVNRVKDYAQGRRLIGRRLDIEPALVSDPDRSLKDVFQAAGQPPA